MQNHKQVLLKVPRFQDSRCSNFQDFQNGSFPDLPNSRFQISRVLTFQIFIILEFRQSGNFYTEIWKRLFWKSGNLDSWKSGKRGTLKSEHLEKLGPRKGKSYGFRRLFVT